jgi:hypothetical protein
VEVGAGATLTRIKELFAGLVASRPAHQTATLRAVVNQLRWFAGAQIRNVSSGRSAGRRLGRGSCRRLQCTSLPPTPRAGQGLALASEGCSQPAPAPGQA